MYCASPNISNYTCCSFGRTGPTGPPGTEGVTGPTGPTGTSNILSLLNVGVGAQIGQLISGSQLRLRTITAGSGITVNQNVNDVNISTSTPLITGVNTLAAGARVLSNITGGIINGRSLISTGAGLAINESLNSISFTVPAYSIASAPGGSSLVSSGFTNAVLRSLIAGPGLSLTSSTNNITFNTSAATTVTNLGTLPGSEGVLVDVLAGSVRAKSILPNGNIQVSSDVNHIYLRPLINVTIPYSGKTILNTYLSGNPELSDFLGFGSNVTVSSTDQTPATYPSLPTSFIGWQSPYRAQIRNVRGICRFSIPTTITEDLDIYSIIHRGKEGDSGLEVVHFERIFNAPTGADIAVGDLIQFSYDPTADIDVGWHLYFSFYALRREGLGNQNLIEFYTSSSMTLVSQDTI